MRGWGGAAGRRGWAAGRRLWATHSVKRVLWVSPQFVGQPGPLVLVGFWIWDFGPLCPLPETPRQPQNHAARRSSAPAPTGPTPDLAQLPSSGPAATAGGLKASPLLPEPVPPTAGAWGPLQLQARLQAFTTAAAADAPQLLGLAANKVGGGVASVSAATASAQQQLAGFAAALGDYLSLCKAPELCATAPARSVSSSVGMGVSTSMLGIAGIATVALFTYLAAHSLVLLLLVASGKLTKLGTWWSACLWPGGGGPIDHYSWWMHPAGRPPARLPARP